MNSPIQNSYESMISSRGKSIVNSCKRISSAF
nr:MAG TPA: hypothetical protein [Caudoviricetes sp.]